MKKKYLFIALGTVIVAIATYLIVSKSQSTPSLSYQEVAVSVGDLQQSAQATGVVEPENRLEIKPPVAGRVEEVLIREGEEVKKGQLLAWMSSTERAALLDAARSSGEKEYKQWEELYRPTPIVAPIDGTIILKNVEAGQTFTNNDAVLVLSNRLTVKAQVDETDIATIKVGQKAEIVLDAYPSQVIAAEVTAIAYEATTTNNVTIYAVDVSPLKPSDFMRSGMTANVNFFTFSRLNVLQVPTAAIQFDDGQSYVLQKGLKQEQHKSPVEIGLNADGMTEIKSGLKEGDIILIQGFSEQSKNSGSNPLSPFGQRRRR